MNLNKTVVFKSYERCRWFWKHGKGNGVFRIIMYGCEYDLKNPYDIEGNMNRYKNYTQKKYSKGYEVHNVQNPRELGVGNDLPHIKWKDGKSLGHIFYEKPN